MDYIEAKKLLTPTKSTEWFGTDYTTNIYRGCCHGCIYCDSRSECYHIDDFDRVRAKENAVSILQDDLRRKIKKGVVGMGAMSDPYNPHEEQLELTRAALKQIDRYGFGVTIATKSPLVTRDIDVLTDIKKHAPVLVKLSITAAEDTLSKMIEQHVAPSSKRFEAVERLASSGLYCGVLLMPVLPFINDTKENMVDIVRRAKQNGARFVYPSFGVTLRQNQREHYFQKLEGLFPGLKEKYIAQYGNQYQCGSPNFKTLYAAFAKECERVGLLYKMKDIIESYKTGYEYQQLSLL